MLKYGQYLDIFSSERDHILDVMQLAEGNTGFPEQLIAAFLEDKEVTAQLQVSEDVNQSLFHLFVEGQHARQLQGLEVLCVGYPFILDIWEEEMLAMPLFFLPFHLFPSKEERKWGFHIQKEDKITMNPFLIDFLSRNGFERCKKKAVQLQNRGHLSGKEMLGLIHEISREMLLESTGERPTLLNFPAVDEMDKMAHAGFMQWSAAAGVFPQVRMIEESVFDFLNEKIPAFPLHSFGMNPINGTKASAIEAIKENRVTIVSGGVGSGKTHLLQYLTTNALLKGGKTLIVSPRLNNLKAIQDSFEKEGCSTLNFLFQNSHNDSELWKNILSARLREKSKKNSTEDERSYQILLQDYLRIKRKMAASYHAIRRNIYADKNWEEIAGLFLKYNEHEKWQLLDSYLQAPDFTFAGNELQEMVDAILLAQPIFQKLGTIQHPLRNLNAGIFVHQSANEGQQFVGSMVQHFSRKGSALQRKIIIQHNAYAEALMTYYSDYYYQLQDQIARLNDAAHDFSTRYDTDLFDAGTWALKINGIIQKKYKAVLTSRAAMYRQLTTLEEQHQEKEYFDFSFAEKPSSLESFIAIVNEYQVALDNWWKSIGGKVQDELLRLSGKTVQVSLNAFKMEIEGLEVDIESYIEELNGIGLYHLPFSANMLTLSKKQKYLEDILGQLEETEYHLRDFDLFFDWQSLWYSFSQEARRVVRALIKVKPRNWPDAFRSWYYYHLLANHQSPLMPNSPYDLERLHQVGNALASNARIALPAIWNKKMEAAKVSLKTTHKKAFNQFLNKADGSEMADILGVIHEPILDLNPICLSSTSQFENWVNLPPNTFDYLLIEEGQLLEEDVLPLFPLANRIVVFNTPLEASNDEYALPALLRNQEVKEVFLTDEERMPEVEVLVRTVSGVYDETTERNEAEVGELIHLLNDIKKTAGRKLPSVAIVCLTASQRNTIFRNLLTIKQQRLAGFEMILQLERNGLAILTADELPGQQFDVIIAGLTFHKASYFKKRGLADWNQVLQMLYSRAMIQLIVVHSLSKKEQFIIHKEKAKAFDSVFSGDRLVNNQEKPESESDFIAYLKGKLQPHFSEGNLVIKGHYLVVKGNNPDEELILLPNGIFSRTPAIDFEEEYQLQAKMSSNGQKIIPIWPVLWWRNPELQTMKFLAYFTSSSSEN